MLGMVAALLAVAIVAALLLTARSLHSRQVTPANPVVPANSVPLPKAGALAPGTYFLANPNVDTTGNCIRACSAYRQIFVTLPAGWATKDGLVYKHLDQPGEVAFSVWTVRDVYADPCHWQASAISPLDIEHSSYDAGTGTLIFLTAYTGGLTNQALRGPSPRPLTAVTLGGVNALRIDLSVPAGLDLSTCDQGEFRSWPVAFNGTTADAAAAESLLTAGANSHHASGQLDTVYMVDVDRWPLVIDASHMPATSAADQAELKAILATMVIVRG
jgi:hypothetical protein